MPPPHPQRDCGTHSICKRSTPTRNRAFRCAERFSAEDSHFHNLDVNNDLRLDAPNVFLEQLRLNTLTSMRIRAHPLVEQLRFVTEINVHEDSHPFRCTKRYFGPGPPYPNVDNEDSHPDTKDLIRDSNNGCQQGLAPFDVQNFRVQLRNSKRRRQRG